MSSNKNTGGPAFPCEWDYIDTSRSAANGMTLRDYFAAKAMQAILIANGKMPELYSDIAEKAYITADAMLEARK